MPGENAARAAKTASLISAVLQGVPPELVAEMNKAVEGAVTDAKAKAPSRTGKLRSEIFGRVTVEGKTVKGEIVSPTSYARYVEFGNSRQRPQPYLRPAARRAKNEMPEHAKRAVRTSINKRV